MADREMLRLITTTTLSFKIVKSLRENLQYTTICIGLSTLLEFVQLNRDAGVRGAGTGGGASFITVMVYQGPSLYYVRVRRGFLDPCAPYVRTISLHRVRKNCHFLDHPPTRGIFRTFELRMLTVMDCPNIAGAKASIAPVLNTPLPTHMTYVV